MQNRLRNFGHPILSFEHNSFNLGLHSAGRYVGFDTLIKTAGLSFNIGHSGFNQIYQDPVSSIVGPIGVFLTPQGTIIRETGPIGPFTISTNAGNAKRRYDLIYAAHDEVEVTGGQDATYVLLKGNINDETKPLPPSTYKNTILGYVMVPAGESADIANCTWYKQRSPDSGDGSDARLDLINIFTKTNMEGVDSRIYITPFSSFFDGATTRYIWAFNATGNTFRIQGFGNVIMDGFSIIDAPLTDGLRVNVQVSSSVSIRRGMAMDVTSSQYIAGYRPIVYNPSFDTSPNEIQCPNLGETLELEFVLLSNQWVLTKVGGNLLTISAPTTGDYTDNILQIIAGYPNAKLYVPSSKAQPYPILHVGKFHVGDLFDPGIDYAVNFLDALGNPKNIGTVSYMVVGSLIDNSADHNGGSTGVWTVINGTKTATGFTLHVNEYAHSITQNLDFEYAIIRLT